MSERTYIFSETEFRRFIFRMLEGREDNGLDDPKTVDFAEKLAVRMNCCAPKAALSGAAAPLVLTENPVQRVNLTTAPKAAPAPSKPKAPAPRPAPAPRKPEPVDPLQLTKRGLV